jgi:hypothetical protein
MKPDTFYFRSYFFLRFARALGAGIEIKLSA